MSEDPGVATAGSATASGIASAQQPTLEDALALGLTRAEYELCLLYTSPSPRDS